MKFEQLFQTGEQLFIEGQWDEAETILKDALSVCHQNFKNSEASSLNSMLLLHYYLGSISKGMGREDEVDEHESVRLEIARMLKELK